MRVRFKNTVIAFVLIFAVSALLLAFSTADVGYTEKTDLANAECYAGEVFRNSARSVQIYGDAMRPFRTVTTTLYGERVVSYNDNFAGAFIDADGFLNVGIVANDLHINALQSGNNFNGQVIYVRQTYSLNRLQNIKEEIVMVALSMRIRHIKIAITQRYNRVCVYLPCEDYIGQISAGLQEKGLYSQSAVKFITDFNGVGRHSGSNVAYGGDILGTQFTVDMGTVGVNAVCNLTGQKGILTNHHDSTRGCANV